LIVDDERLARSELRRLLAAHTDIEVIAEAANAAEARVMMSNTPPDAVISGRGDAGRERFRAA
jgi:two-component system, LytTR family, response regulator